MTTVKLARHQIEKVYLLCNKVKDEKHNPKFSYFVIRNIKFLESEFTSIYELRNSTVPTTGIIEFNTKRDELVNIYAVRNMNGEIIMTSYHENGIRKTKPYFGDNEKEYVKAEQKLLDEYYDVVTEYDKNKTDVIDLMSEEIEVNVFKISFKDIPEHLFTIEDLFFLSPLFRETEEELDEMFSDTGEVYVSV
jgi:hypothetical protein